MESVSKGAGRQLRGRGPWVVALMMGGQLDEANRRCGEDLKRVVEGKVRENES